MKLLLDTHLLLWAANGIERVPTVARALIATLITNNTEHFKQVYGLKLED